MTSDPLRSRALAVLRSGRCRVVNVVTFPGGAIASAEVHVKSSRNNTIYVLDYHRQTLPAWNCTCRDGMATPPIRCAHIAAAELVTTGAHT